MKATLSGLRAWTVQRATALVLTGFALYLPLKLLVAPPAGPAEWRAWVLAPATRAGLMLLLLALVLHAWVGGRDVILDYLKPLPLRLAALGLLALALAAHVLWLAALLFPA
jgi:succinate dehydrogenase / fumarate reductase, membrane anchor subunit